MDPIGWYIATLHSLIGHDKTAVVLGQSAGDKDQCVICLYEDYPTETLRQEVIAAIGTAAAGD
jgi:hypothetical protein